MANKKFKEMQDEILSAEQVNNSAFYQLSDQLIEQGYKYDAEGIYCPLKISNAGSDLFLKIDRQHQNYGFTIGSYDNSFQSKTLTFNSKKSICSDESKRNESLFKNFKKILSNNSKIVENEFDDVIFDIGVNLSKEDDFDQITKEFGFYKNKEEASELSDYELYLLEIEESINWRKNPQLTEEQLKDAEVIKEKIMPSGLVDYLDSVLDNIQIGSHKNIYRKLLGAFNVMRGRGSYLFETISDSGLGKSFEDMIVFEIMVPQEYIFKKNNMTEASFLRYSEMNPYYFNRLIIFFGDFGSKKSFQKIEPVFDVIKILITEKAYSKDLAEQKSSGGYESKSLDLVAESIGGVYSTTLNSFTDDDPQLESRTLKSTTFENDEDEIIDLILYLDVGESKQNIEKREAIDELVLFQSYLLSLVNFDKQIINPYKSIFKRYLKGSTTPFRELKRLIDLFNAYCVLTYYECDERNGYLIASEKQVETFFDEICLDNVLIPYESNFINMLKAEGKNTKLTIIDDGIDYNLKQQTDPLNEYFNTVIEYMYEGDEKKMIPSSFDDLEEYMLRQGIKTLLKLYKLGGTSVEHKENVFFRKSDIKRIYGRYKAYKDIEDVSKLLHNLYLKGYLNKLEYKDPNSHENIYYLTSKCNDIKFSLEITPEDKKEIEKFFIEIGFYDID